MRADGYFGSAGGQKEIAHDLYEHVVDRPLISLHGYVNPRLFADSNATFGTSAALFFIPTIMLRVCCIRRAFRWRNYFLLSLGEGLRVRGTPIAKSGNSSARTSTCLWCG